MQEQVHITTEQKASILELCPAYMSFDAYLWEIIDTGLEMHHALNNEVTA